MIRSSIRRPVAVAMTYLAVALLGVAAWQGIPIELLPDTDLPRLRITATWPGASPQTVEAFLTSPVEGAVQEVRGVENITSVSYQEFGLGRARIDVEFARDTEMDFARLELSERMATLEEELPPGIGPIQVDPYVPEEFQEQESRSFLRYTITGPHTPVALRAHVDDVVVPALSQLDGVALVDARGGRERLLEITLDPRRVTALGLTPPEVVQRVNDLDLVREAGAVRDGGRQWTVTVRNRAEDPGDVRTAVVSGEGGRVVRLADVGTVRDTYEEARSHYRIDGRPAVSFDVIKEIGANTVRVAERVKAEMARLEGRAPAGSRYVLEHDESEDIERQLTDLRARAAVAAGVIFVVLLLFLGSFRSAAVVFATIAFSVLIALNLIYFGGLSLNLLTLMGLAMGFGLIVDNSIVVLENVYRRWQGGEEAAGAAEKGAREVAMPILASTATTLIVFVPFVYLQGELRIYYVPLAIVVGLTLLASLFVAFTFIPSLTSRILEVGGGPTSPSVAPEDGPSPEPLYIRFYRGLVGFTLRHPWIAVAVAALCFGGSFYLFDRYVTRGVVWGGGWGQDTYISIRIELPRGADLERTDRLVRAFEDRLRTMPEVGTFNADVQGTFGSMRVEFPDSLERTAVPVAIKEQLVAFSLGFSGADVRVYGYGPSFYGGGSSPPNYSIKVLGYNYERVQEIAENIGARLERLSRVREVDTNASGRWYERDRATEFVVDVNRDALARHEMSVREFVQRMNAAVGGNVARRTMKLGGEDVRFDVKLAGYEGTDVLELRNTMVGGAAGGAVRVGDVVTIDSREVLGRIRRENQQYERSVAYEFRGPRKLGDLYRDAVVEATELPPGYEIESERSFSWSDEEREQIYFVLAVSVLLIFMVTAALFESLRQPLCVLLTVPMALIGVFLIFFYTDASFTREAYVGVIMMGGIVVNNAILLVDHVNRVRGERGREAGLADFRDAILTGTLERVRPILMTTATTVLGLLPLVLFSEAADANIWNALTYALIGGLLSSTIFVLTTTPALYYLFEKGRVGRSAEV